MEKLLSDEGRLILYDFCMHYHSGQWSRGYRLLCRVSTRYKNMRITSATERELEETELYYALVAKYGNKI